MKYAIAHDCSDGWSFVLKDIPKGEPYREEKVLFDTFGEAYVHAISMGYSSKFEIF